MVPAFGAPGEGQSFALARQSRFNLIGTPKIFHDLTEQQAMCAFFLDFVLIPRHPDSRRCPLAHLLPIYNDSPADSALALITSSLALSLSGSPSTRLSNHQQARSLFIRALKKISTTIQHPTDSLKDSTLLAVLLLGLYERVHTTAKAVAEPSVNMTSVHNAGASALVKHRAAANCASPQAIALLFATRTQLVEHHIEESLIFERCPDKLANLFKVLPQNAAARLTSATVNISDLRARAKSALVAPHTRASEHEITELLEYSISIDLLVASWAETVPASWKWDAATGFDTPAHLPPEYFQYLDKKDSYLDLWVLSIWNQYRAARIRIQNIILACITYLGTEHAEKWYWRAVYAKMTLQEMADWICASVPFALGTNTSYGPAGDRDVIEYPFVEEKGKVDDKHKRAACAMGGWHLLSPLRTILKSREDCGTEGVLREGQELWCLRQLERIARIYALKEEEVGERVEIRGESVVGNAVWGESFF